MTATAPQFVPTQPAHRRYDLVVVGGGLVGLATARELLRRRPGLRLAVLEKEAGLARHQSGHNSGVIHTGLYYAPGSLKARACVEGHRRLLEYCRERGIRFELCGKVIVALDRSELPGLEELYRRGQANGVAGLEMIGPERLREIEPQAAGIRAIYSPNTGIIDFVQVALNYAAEVREMGGEIITGCEVRHLDARGDLTYLGVQAGPRQTELEARQVVTCGGLYSDRLAGMSGGQPEVRIVPFRGDYYTLRNDRRWLVRGLIYPVPDPRFPFLGVHFTRRVDGEVWAGPNAVLAFAREGYRRQDVRPPELLDTLAYRGFWKLAARYWRMGLGEMYRDYSKRAFYRALQRYLPELQPDDLRPGPSGVRAQALDPAGRLVDDFLVKHGPHVVHVQNAPSPAATSSLVIARLIADKVG